jgi:hypothetical protein
VSRSLLSLALGCWVAACSDPVRDEVVAALGGETEGVPVGPLHRPGQPCLACHDGGKGPVFSVAGTVYSRATDTLPLNRITVQMVDTDGRPFNATTNCAGNFFVRPSEFTPHYPLWVTLAVGTQKIDMESPVYRDGSCASCHTDPKGSASAGHVYFLLEDDPDLPAPNHCR